jgi:hypothetical protein
LIFALACIARPNTMAVQVTTFLKWHLVEDSASILNPPTLCIHVNQGTPHKDIRFQTTLNDLLMNTPALFKGNYAGTCFQHTQRSNKVWLHTLLLHLSK